MNDPSHPAHRPRPRHWEMLTAVASGFVAVAALVTSTYNVYLQRQQVRAQVWPRLTFDTQLSESRGLVMILTNRGAGPAEVRRVRVTVDGKPVVDWPDAITKLLGRGDFGIPEITPMEDQIVSPGLELTVLRVKDPQDARKIVAGLGRLDIELCYTSSLGDAWVLGSPGPDQPVVTRSVPECTPDPKAFHSISERALGEMLLRLASDAGKGDAGATE